MNRKSIIIGVILMLALAGGIIYRFTHLRTGGEDHAEKTEAGHQEEKTGGHVEEPEGEEEHAEADRVKMTAEAQRQNGVLVVEAAKQLLGGAISVTGKVAVNADRIAHVSPRIPGKIVSVRASLGDSVASGQALVTLDSIELGEALNRYHQAKTRLRLAKDKLDRALALSEKKIIARKDVFQAESDYQIAQADFHNDEERLLLYGLSVSGLKEGKQERPLLTVRSPISGVITAKEAVVGELSDPARSLYTVADLALVWVLVDINEKDLAKVHKSQDAIVTVGAFPDLKLQGRKLFSIRIAKSTVPSNLEYEVFLTSSIASAIGYVLSRLIFSADLRYFTDFFFGLAVFFVLLEVCLAGFFASSLTASSSTGVISSVSVSFSGSETAFFFDFTISILSWSCVLRLARDSHC